MKKNIILTFIYTFFILIISEFVFASELPPEITADGIVLMDAKTGQILYSKNPDTPYPPASTTKTMTALLTIENCDMEDIVTIGKNPPLIEGSRLGIMEGEKIKVKDLLYGLLLVSGNDCAEALAEHIAGSSAKFGKMMTLRAEELGCKNTNFVNPSGLYDKNHKTSANDLALIMRELSKHDVFLEISTTPCYKVKPINKNNIVHCAWNQNRMIHKNDKYYYPGYEGGKTGYTVKSLFSYTAVASKNDQQLIVAMVHNKFKTYYNDAKLLFDFGFNNFELVKLYSKGDKVQDYVNGKFKLPLICAEDFYYVRRKNYNDIEKPKIAIEDTDLKNKNFNRGEPILTGTVYTGTVYTETKQLGTINLASDTDHIVHTKLNIIDCENFNKKDFIVLLITSILIVSLIIIIKDIFTKIKKNV